MEPNPLLFRDLTYIFLAAVVGGLVAWRLRLPLILGFVVGGIVISPFTPGPHLSELHTFEVFAEVGVVLLMFSIGFEFSIPDLMRVKWIALIGAPIGILLMMGIAVGGREAVRMDDHRGARDRCDGLRGEHDGAGTIIDRQRQDGHDMSAA